MKVIDTRTVRYTTYATIIAEGDEVLTKEAIAEKYFYPFGGYIAGMTDKTANIEWYND